jgi:hypothetical protein
MWPQFPASVADRAVRPGRRAPSRSRVAMRAGAGRSLTWSRSSFRICNGDPEDLSTSFLLFLIFGRKEFLQGHSPVIMRVTCVKSKPGILLNKHESCFQLPQGSSPSPSSLSPAGLLGALYRTRWKYFSETTMAISGISHQVGFDIISK